MFPYIFVYKLEQHTSFRYLYVLLILFFFFFFEKEINSFNNQQKLLSNNTRLVASLWMSFNQIRGKRDFRASFANMSATLFPFLFTCEKTQALELTASYRESSMRGPKGAMHSSSVLKEFTMISASPSNITSRRPSSWANKIALLPARASTSSTDGGKAILSDSAPITLPSWSLITTPRSTDPSSWKMAPSKLALHQEMGGGD